MIDTSLKTYGEDVFSEKAIRDFVPEPYWILGVRAAKQTPPTAPFTARPSTVTPPAM